MPVDKTSRYKKTDSVFVEGLDGQLSEMIDIREILVSRGVFNIKPNVTDRLDLLAYRYYRDPLKFWLICDASSQMDPFDVLEPGESLVVPPKK